MSAPETVKNWIRYAEGDLRVAQQSLQDEIPAYPTICFLCQSAAEKYLKAYLIHHGWELQKNARPRTLV